MFFQYLKTTIQFSKEVAHIIDEQVKFQYICLCWITFSLLLNLNENINQYICWLHLSTPHVGSFISCNHMLTKDINAQQKPLKVGRPSRWRRSKMWRSPSSPQIHQKYIYKWKTSYRTPTYWTLAEDLRLPKRYMYFFPFPLFVSVYVYVSWCDFVCIALS